MTATEPAWKPVWTVNGDDACWTVTVDGPDGECLIQGVPGTLGRRSTLDLFVTKLGTHTMIPNLEAAELRVLRAIIDEHLTACEELEANTPTPELPPAEIPARSGNPIALTSMTRGTYRGYWYTYAAHGDVWKRGAPC